MSDPKAMPHRQGATSSRSASPWLSTHGYQEEGVVRLKSRWKQTTLLSIVDRRSRTSHTKQYQYLVRQTLLLGPCPVRNTQESSFGLRSSCREFPMVSGVHPEAESGVFIYLRPTIGKTLTESRSTEPPALYATVNTKRRLHESKRKTPMRSKARPVATFSDLRTFLACRCSIYNRPTMAFNFNFHRLRVVESSSRHMH